MLRLQLGRSPGDGYRILCLGAHCDDIEIGCGGTILHLLAENAGIEVLWVIFSSSDVRGAEARSSANQFLCAAKEKTVIIENHRDGFFPYVGAQIKERFEELKRQFIPDIVFTHYRHDLHQDHRVISELTWNTFRDHLILEYEIPKYDGDLGAPNFFVPLDESLCRKKIKLVRENFVSQQGKQWFSEDTFLGLLRLRGMEAGETGRYAEAFYCRKAVL